jgi:hypothetical protein
MKRNGTKGKTLQRGKSLNNSKVQSFQPKGNFVEKGAPLKGTNPRGMLMGNQRNMFQLQ